MPKKKVRLPVCDWMRECFGQGDEELQSRCPCPPTCKALCASRTFRPELSPRVITAWKGRRPYTNMLNAIARDWGRKVPDPVKLTYIFLVTWTRADTRWIFRAWDDLARDRGITKRQFEKHCTHLEKLNMIEKVPHRLIAPSFRAPNQTILVLDLPNWFPGWKEMKAEGVPDDAAADDEDEDDDEVAEWIVFGREEDEGVSEGGADVEEKEEDADVHGGGDHGTAHAARVAAVRAKLKAHKVPFERKPSRHTAKKTKALAR